MKRKLFLSIFLMVFASSVGAQAIMDTQYGQAHDPTNLTDQDKDLSENFVHDELVQKVYEEECTADSSTEDACLGNKADPSYMGMKSSMVSALAKAYTMIIGTAGGDLSTTKSDWAKSEEVDQAAAKPAQGDDAASAGDDAADNTNGEGQDDEQKDYCKYIPMATEAIGMFNTSADQNSISNLPTKEDTQQKDSLLKAAANHDSRAKTAKIQTTGWGAGTACYITMLSTTSATWGSTSNLLKLGASTLLTTFYYNQIDAHEKYADKTRKIANGLPGKGDCNPITDKLCFCIEQQETSKKRADYQQYCQPEMHSNNIAYTSERVTCVNENLKEDPKCVCSQTNTCVDKKVMTTISGLNGQGMLSSPTMSNLSTLAQGELTSKGLTTTQSNLSNALAKLKELDKKVELDPNVILSPAQKLEAQVLKDMGLPANIATKLALTPTSSEAAKMASKFNGNFKNSKRSYSNKTKKKSNVLTFSGGSGINSNNKRKTKKKPDFLSRFGLKKKSKKKNSKTVLRFAQKAENQAQISRNSDRMIFDIISRRYQVSGWRRLEYIK